MRLITFEGDSRVKDGTGLDVKTMIERITPVLGPDTWVRIPMFYGIDPHVYVPKLAVMKALGVKTLLEPIDSELAREYPTAAEYAIRVDESLYVCTGLVDAVEAGNEINGERRPAAKEWKHDDWPGPLMFEKTQAAMLVAQARKIPVAITYYLPCDDVQWLWTWIAMYRLPPPTYALLSIYPWSTPGVPGCPALWNILPRLAKETRAKHVGIGEWGFQNPAGKLNKRIADRPAGVLDFEGRKPTCPEDVMGGGYWNGYQDLRYKNITAAFRKAWGLA